MHGHYCVSPIHYAWLPISRDKFHESNCLTIYVYIPVVFPWLSGTFGTGENVGRL